MPLTKLSNRNASASSQEIKFDSFEVNQALGLKARMLLAFGIRVQTEWKHESFHLKRASIARRIGLSPRALKSALEVLTQARLQTWLGWCADFCSTRQKDDTVAHVPKRVFRTLEKNARGEYIAAPELKEWAAQKAQRRARWGGYRYGRHRLRLRRHFVQRLVDVTLKCDNVTANCDHPKSRRKTQVGPANESDSYQKSSSDSLWESSDGQGRPPELTSENEMEKLLGRACQGRHRQAEIVRVGKRLVPPYPGEQLIPTVKIPAPPCLTTTPAESVPVLATCYRGVLSVRFHRSSHFFLKGAPEGHRLYGTLLRAAEVLAGEFVPPAAWCLFSADVWRRYHPEQVVPPAFVYSLTRITSDQGWFESESEKYCGGQVRYAPEHQQILADYYVMWQELLRITDVNRSSIMGVVDCFFPAQSFEERIRLAKMQARKMQVQIDQALASGGMLWGQ